MELEIRKDSFIDEFVNVKNMGNRTVYNRTEGFMYLHNSTTKRLTNGKNFEVADIDFSKFTTDDLTEYLRYYRNVLEPKINMVRDLFKVLDNAESIFSVKKRYY